VFRLANQVRNEAVKSIQTSPRTGRKYKRGGVVHIASSPGNPPATDTGKLVQSIRVEHQPGSGAAKVVVGAEYAAALEFGSGKIAPRPFLRSAVKAVKSQSSELAKSVNIKIEK